MVFPSRGEAKKLDDPGVGIELSPPNCAYRIAVLEEYKDTARIITFGHN